MLTGVTITGADDDVALPNLVDLSAKFPFVEWGVLVSAKRMGERRYPSRSWIVNAARLRLDDPFGYGVRCRVALHLCGDVARKVMGALTTRLPDFDRYQLNGWEPGSVHAAAEVNGSSNFILQCRSEDTLMAASREVPCLGHHAGILFDPSGGRGIEPFRWPSSPLEWPLGYAGGINPDNVEQVIADIATANLHAENDWWIDMESGVRTDDRFDLDKVHRVLELAAPHVAGGSS